MLGGGGGVDMSEEPVRVRLIWSEGLRFGGRLDG